MMPVVVKFVYYGFIEFLRSIIEGPKKSEKERNQPVSHYRIILATCASVIK